MSIRAVPIALLALFLPLTASPAVAGSGPSDGERGPGRCVRALPSGTQTIQVGFGSAAYPVRVHIPVDALARVPIVLNLHFSNGNADQQAAYSGLEPVGDREGFVTVEPNGNIPAATPNPNQIWFWNVPGVPTTAGSYPPPDARDDIAFLTKVLDDVTRLVCGDSSRVYVAGHSGGARMASAYACARPDKVAALAASAGLRAGRPSPTDPMFAEVQTCAPNRPVPVITFHGDADTTNPYQGRATDLRWGYSTPLAVQSWAQLDRCTTGPAVVAVSPHVNRLTYTGCAGGAQVVLYKVAGGTHSWPGSAADSGATKEIEASTLIWQFFQAHRRF
ncbi:PHB depolymerase family esterase [Streptomyces sp. SID13031]|uniref:alpha/beta hydrolase family esterase n=1 Tax=Streptomyces sp. SID13031 TaxID=2706046 RepID=UPI0013C60530|nr:PHB depolymerase family esterase [Streptomyces sp. SID13031]NEA30210.1 polyhydroxybutyrate depolymerase [Streptomyces sp. SID13031]